MQRYLGSIKNQKTGWVMFMCNPTPYFFFGVLTASLTPLHSAIATIKIPPNLIKIFLYIFFQFQLKK